jgi:outer membrane immunogenic protein
MRKLAFCAAAAACLVMAAPAMASDMYDGSMKDAPVEPIVHAPIWAGLYVGGTVGFGTGDTSGKLDIDTPVLQGLADAVEDLLATDYDVDGAVYGALIGYNWQHGSKVFGIEAAINGSDIDGSTDCGFIGLADCERDLSYYGTVTGRLGYAMGSILLYGFGGVAWGEVETDVSVAGFALDALSEDTTHVGWTAGVGLDFALTQNVIAGVQYEHVDLGEESYDVVEFGPIDIDNNVDMDFDVVKFRAIYKFGGHHQPLEGSYK